MYPRDAVEKAATADETGHIPTPEAAEWLCAHGYAIPTPEGPHLNQRGRGLLPTGHPAVGFNPDGFVWGRDGHPVPEPVHPNQVTPELRTKFRRYFAVGPGRTLYPPYWIE